MIYDFSSRLTDTRSFLLEHGLSERDLTEGEQLEVVEQLRDLLPQLDRIEWPVRVNFGKHKVEIDSVDDIGNLLDATRGFVQP